MLNALFVSLRFLLGNNRLFGRFYRDVEFVAFSLVVVTSRVNRRKGINGGKRHLKRKGTGETRVNFRNVLQDPRR